jgi:hypothetical protein
MFLTEGRKERWFQRLQKYSDNRTVIEGENNTSFALSCTEEAYSLSITSNNCCPLYLISGKQIVTKERLEVLALACESDFPEGRRIEETVRLIIERGAVPVIPWGFGKWYGRRAGILREFLDISIDSSNVFLGDNSGRPSFLPAPAHFRIGKEKGIRILPGSDPLPFFSESTRAGSFGFTVRGSIRRERPGEDIKNILLDPATTPSPFGSLETPYRFMKNQIGMQILKLKNPH